MRVTSLRRATLRREGRVCYTFHFYVSVLLVGLKHYLFEASKSAIYVFVTSTKLTATCILLLTQLLGLNIMFALCTSFVDHVGSQSALAICRATDAVTTFAFRSCVEGTGVSSSPSKGSGRLGSGI